MHVTRVHEAQVPKRHYISLKRCFFLPKNGICQFCLTKPCSFLPFFIYFLFFYNVLYLFHLYHILSHICDEFNFYVSYILIRSDFCQYWFLKKKGPSLWEVSHSEMAWYSAIIAATITIWIFSIKASTKITTLLPTKTVNAKITASNW